MESGFGGRGRVGVACDKQILASGDTWSKKTCLSLYESPCDCLTWYLLLTHIPLFLFLRASLPFLFPSLSWNAGWRDSDQVISMGLFQLWQFDVFSSPLTLVMQRNFLNDLKSLATIYCEFFNFTPCYTFPVFSMNTERLLSCGNRDRGWEFLTYKATQNSSSYLMHIEKKTAIEFSHLSEIWLISSYSPCLPWGPS